MISYEPFWKTLKKKNLTTYYLIFKQGFTSSTIHRMRKGLMVSLDTIDQLCSILSCEISDIICYKEEAAPDETGAAKNPYDLTPESIMKKRIADDGDLPEFSKKKKS